MSSGSVILVALALALGGCRDREVAQLEHVKKAVCACKDTRCAEAALKELPQGEVQANHRERGLARDMLDCLAKLYEAERPVTDPGAAP
jgi:hypothetical protein